MSQKRENNEIKFYDMRSDFNGNIKHFFEADVNHNYNNSEQYKSMTKAIRFGSLYVVRRTLFV